MAELWPAAALVAPIDSISRKKTEMDTKSTYFTMALTDRISNMPAATHAMTRISPTLKPWSRRYTAKPATKKTKSTGDEVTVVVPDRSSLTADGMRPPGGRERLFGGWTGQGFPMMAKLRSQRWLRAGCPLLNRLHIRGGWFSESLSRRSGGLRTAVYLQPYMYASINSHR